MAIHLVGSVLQLVMGLFEFIAFTGFWIGMNNKNNRKDLLAICAGVALVYAVQQGYYLTGDNRFPRLDGVYVQWEFPIFTAVQGVLLALGTCVFLACDYHYILAILIKVAFAGFAMTMGFISGDPANEGKTHSFWFCVSGATLVCAFIVAAVAHARQKDKWGWAAIAYTVAFNILLAAAWLCGPVFLGVITEESQYWMFFVVNFFLFFLLPILLVSLQGEEDSIVSKIRGAIAKHQREKYCTPESAPLTQGDNAV